MKRISPDKLILIICLLAFVATAAVAYFAFERLPHLEDEVAYLFQARTMALGRLTVPTPANPHSFWVPFVLDYQGHRFGKYPPGWPAVLAVGVLAGVPWLVNPLLAALSVYLIYRLGKTLYDERAGLLAAVLGITSPLFLVLSGSFLSHLASLTWLLLFSLWFLWTVRGRSAWFALGAGVALGMAFLTRSLTAVAFAAPFVVYSLAQVIRRKPHWPSYLLIAAAGGAVAALLPAYQWAVTGDPWLNPYVLWWPYDRLGFGPDIGSAPGGHSLYYSWINLKQDLPRAATDLLGWPALSWIPLVLGLSLRPRRAKDWSLLAPFVCLVLAYLFYWIGSPSRLWGPRYYFEGFGGLWLLSAVGLLKVWDWDSKQMEPWLRPGQATALILIGGLWLLGAAGLLKASDRTRESVQRWLRPAAVGALVLIVTASLAINLPHRLGEAHGFYGVTRSQLDPIEEAGLHDALVIVYAARWLEYGAMLGEASPLLDDDVVYARGQGEGGDDAVIALYPDRAVYYLQDGVLSTEPPAP